MNCQLIVGNDNTQKSRSLKSMLIFTVRFAQKAALVFKINLTGIATQQIVSSANLEYYLYHTCYPWYMHYDWKIECWEAENVFTHTWMAYHLFHNFEFPDCHQMAQVAFRAEVVVRAEVLPVLVEVCRLLCTSSVSGDPLVCHFGTEGSSQYDFYKPLPGVFLKQPSQLYARETELLASSVVGLQHEVSWLVVAFPLLQSMKTLLWPFSP